MKLLFTFVRGLLSVPTSGVRAPSIVICLAGILFLTGCGTRDVPLLGSPDDAVAAVNDVLRAWKSGRKPEDLQEELGILVVDYEWTAGATLIDFTIDPKPQKFGPSWKVDAVLTLTSPDKVELPPAPAAFTVTLEPKMAVFRMDTLN